jgi:hypothetical protein
MFISFYPAVYQKSNLLLWQGLIAVSEDPEASIFLSVDQAELGICQL